MKTILDDLPTSFIHVPGTNLYFPPKNTEAAERYAAQLKGAESGVVPAPPTEGKLTSVALPMEQGPPPTAFQFVPPFYQTINPSPGNLNERAAS